MCFPSGHNIASDLMSHLGEQEDLGGCLCHFICSNYLSKKPNKWRQVCFTYPLNLCEMNLSQSLLKLNSLYRFGWRVLQALCNLWVNVIWEDPPNSLWILYFPEITDSSSTDQGSLPLQCMMALKGSFSPWARLHLQSRSFWSCMFL